MYKKVLPLLLIVTFLKGLLWAGITPIFQGPDEPFHYSNVQYFAEGNEYKFFAPLCSEEVEKALNYLEVAKISFNKDKKQTFSNSLIGINEEKIIKIDKKERKIISKNNDFYLENPPLYYLIGTIFYKLSLKDNLIWRVYLLRVYSIICFLLFIYFSYKIFSLLFSKKKAILFVSVLSFLPMPNFTFGLINNENLYILLVTLIIYYLVKDLIKNEFNFFKIGFLSALAFLTKQNFFPIFLAIFFIIFLRNFLLERKIDIKKIVLTVFIFSLISSFWYFGTAGNRKWTTDLIKNTFLRKSYWYNPRDKNLLLKPIPYFVYFWNFLKHGEPKKIFNYFWGTFGWVDTRLPRIVYQIVFGFCFLSFLGFLRYLKRAVPKWRENLWLWEMILLTFTFIFFLSLFEWRYYQAYQNFFLQGRYFFPVILPIITFLVLGWQSSFPKKWQDKALFFLVILTIIFNFYCLFFIMIPRYYSAYEPVGLVIQLSQYKPEFLKGISWPVLISVYLIFLVKLIKGLYLILLCKNSKS